MSTTWFTSDPHFGHAFVAKLRGFGDTIEHDETIAANWRKSIRDDDRVWVLGDLAMSKPDDALAILGGLPGTKHLIAGNHDPASPIHRQSFKYQRQYLNVFESIQAYARIRVQKQNILLSHYPYLGEGDDHTTEARYAQYRLPDLGEWLIHGHTHNADQRRHGHQIHVGLDAWGLSPVPLGTVEKLIAEAG